MKFYTYIHTRDDKNEIFYVGVGTKSKQDIKCKTYSRAYSKHVDNNIWLKIVAKTNWKLEIIEEFNNREEALLKEKELIKKYGRKCDNTGTLANLTLGGEDNNGYRHSEETKKKIGVKAKGKTPRLGKKLTKEQLISASIRQKEIANRPEMIEYRRNLAKGNDYHLDYKHSEESKLKMSESAKKRGVNSITIPCKLIDIINDIYWEASSIKELSLITPLSLSTISRIKHNLKISDKIAKQYKFELINGKINN